MIMGEINRMELSNQYFAHYFQTGTLDPVMISTSVTVLFYVQRAMT
jgi:hypothetical protein